MDVLVDRRTIRGEPDPEALQALSVLQPSWLDGEIRLARLFARIDAKAAFLFEGAASLEELASRRGFDGFRARDLMHLGHALEGLPPLEAALRSGQVGFPAACALGQIYRDPRLLLPEDDWLTLARFSRLRDLRRAIRRRVEALRQARPEAELVSYSAAVGHETRDALDHCRTLASQRARQLLTKGQTLQVLATTYVLAVDPTWRPRRPRRSPPTATNLEGRGVPAEVVRRVHERSGGLCEFGGCERPATELCHLVPHAEGSPREAEDLVGGCPDHHKAYDVKWIRFFAWSKDRLPVFRVAATGEILAPKPRPAGGPEAPGTASPLPEWLRRALPPRARTSTRRGGPRPLTFWHAPPRRRPPRQLIQ